MRLKEQIDHLRFSADEFDKGRDAEASRLAIAMRILLHDSKNSKSLLGQLNILDRLFWDTSIPSEGDNLLTTHSLVGMSVTEERVDYCALLDDVPFSRQQKFNNWWITPVFIDNQGRQLTRRDLVLICADQDGGAHVDTSVDESYFDLEFENSMGWKAIVGGENVSLNRPGRVAIRQVAHETIKTLVPNYENRPSIEAGVTVAGASVVLSNFPD